MLLERIPYGEDFPMNIRIARLTEDPLHYHLDIEFLYVLKGRIQLKNGYCFYELQEGDIFTNSGHELHGMKALTEDNVVAVIHISSQYFSQYFPNINKACYRTYSHKTGDARHDILRGLLLQILLKYVTGSFNYKSECAYRMGDTIKHLNKYFNLFTFDKEMVVGFDRGNPVAIERISRICQYIYQNYAENITLEDLSEMEHLSPFYLSHLIKNFTGMNYRELLCFARVEWSELSLLGSDKKVSQIAREVGFSTTSYYRKYFEKWFGATPEEHRKRYLPKIKSNLHPAVYEDLPTSRIIEIVKGAHANYSLKKGSDSVIENLHLDAVADARAAPLRPFASHLAVCVTGEDLQVLGERLLPLLEELGPEKVVLLRREQEDPEKLRALSRLLRRRSFAVEKRPAPPEKPPLAANDSVAAAICLLGRCMESQAPALEVPLRDSGDGTQLLQGKEGLVTASGIRKPLFHVCRILSRLRGELICQGSSYWVLRLGEGTFFVLASHGADTMEQLLATGADQRTVKSTVNDYKDEVSLCVQLNLKPGRYSVVKYRLNRGENLFAYLGAMDFPDRIQLPADILESLSGGPAAEVYVEEVRSVCQITFSIKGAGIQAAFVQGEE